MKKCIKFLFAIILVIFTVTPYTSAHAKIDPASLGYKLLASPATSSELKKVSKYTVESGDKATFTLEDGTEVKAHLLLINAPTTSQDSTFVKESKERLEALLKDAEEIKIEYDSENKQDQDHRDLVYVWVDGLLVQEILTTEGYARVQKASSSTQSRYLTPLEESQTYAQKNKLAIWSKSPAPANNTVQTQAAAPAAAVFYQNCKEVRAAGKAPIYPGDPGWDPKFDRDHDGIGCE